MLSLKTLMPLVGQSLSAPRAVARYLFGLGLDRAILWQALALVVVLSILVAEITNMVIAARYDVTAPMILASPLVMGVIQLSLLILTVYLIYWVGRGMGGVGEFENGIVTVAWLQFVFLCIQLLQSLLILVMPALAALMVPIGIALFFWLLTNFVAELHGFSSLGRVFGMILVVLVGVALGLSFLLTLVGVTVPDIS